jgi:hypothetical protein
MEYEKENRDLFSVLDSLRREEVHLGDSLEALEEIALEKERVISELRREFFSYEDVPRDTVLNDLNRILDMLQSSWPGTR